MHEDQVFRNPENVKGFGKPSTADTMYAASMAFACFVSYEVSSLALSRIVDRGDQFLGGMWAAVATVFVFKDSQSGSISAGVGRLVATGVSFVLCLVYLCLFPFTPAGLGLVIGAGTLVMIMLDRRDDIVTAGITSSVVMVVAALSPRHAWHQPLLRVFDTVAGIAVGVSFDWLGRSLTAWLKREEQDPHSGLPSPR